MSDAFWGDLPSWITTGAVVIAAVQYLGERAQRTAEGDRESRAQATQLTVWVVKTPDPHPRYGVRVLNTSGSTFHDVRMKPSIHGEKTRTPIDLLIVPPGDFFIEQNAPGQKYVWAFACGVDEVGAPLAPLMKTLDYSIDQVWFSDNAGVHWHTNDRALLTRGPGASASSPSLTALRIARRMFGEQRVTRLAKWRSATGRQHQRRDVQQRDVQQRDVQQR